MDALAIAAWFDQFDWALTPVEYAAYGVGVPDAARVVDGFVVLPGREELAWMRRRKSVWAWRKLRKARRWSRVLGWLPFVRMIAVGNALGYGNCRDSSDIDLVIIAAPRRVWLTRLCIGGLLKLLHQRPGEHGVDALCPSFFFTTEALNLEPLKIAPKNKSTKEQENVQEIPADPYLMFWMTQLMVLVDRDGTYDAFWRANAAWVRRWLPHAEPRAEHPRFVRRSRGLRPMAYGRRLDALERWARRLQERRLTPEVRVAANRDGRVVIDDRMIKLHTNDRRKQFRDLWITKLQVKSEK